MFWVIHPMTMWASQASRHQRRHASCYPVQLCGQGMHRLLSEDSGKDSGQKLMDLCLREKSEQF
jgi:hypothetical protein